MKQRIVFDQLNELSQEGKSKLSEWAIRHKYLHFTEPHLLPSIGQMIEFLYDDFKKTGEMIYLADVFSIDDSTPDLCDDLWKVVKEILENETSEKVG